VTVHAPTYPGDVLTLTTAESHSRPSIRIMCDGGFVIPRPFTRPEPDPGSPVVVGESPAAMCDDCGRFVPAGHGQTWPPFWVCYDCHPKRDDSPAALIARLTAGDKGQ